MYFSELKIEHFVVLEVAFNETEKALMNGWASMGFTPAGKAIFYGMYTEIKEYIDKEEREGRFIRNVRNEKDKSS